MRLRRLYCCQCRRKTYHLFQFALDCWRFYACLACRTFR